jgi:hypothetical protein
MRGFGWLGIGLAAVLVMAGCETGGEGVQPQPTTASSTVTTAPSPTPTPTPGKTAPPGLRLGPDGFGALKMGMTKAEAVATGLTEGTTPGKGTCGANEGHLLGTAAAPVAPTQHAGWLVFSSTTDGLVAVYAYPGIATPEGVGLGSSYADVHAAYPDWKPIAEEGTDGRGHARVPGAGEGSYRIVIRDGVVIELSLDVRQDCYE